MLLNFRGGFMASLNYHAYIWAKAAQLESTNTGKYLFEILIDLSAAGWGISKYQPSSAEGTRSPPAALQHLHNQK